MQAGLETPEQCHVSCIPDGVADRVEAGGQVEPEGRCDTDQVPESHMWQQRALDPTDLRSRDADGPSNVCLAQAGPDASLPQFVAKLEQHLPESTLRVVSGSFSRRHSRIMGGDTGQPLHRDFALDERTDDRPRAIGCPAPSSRLPAAMRHPMQPAMAAVATRRLMVVANGE
jgi:hypothetical protein